MIFEGPSNQFYAKNVSKIEEIISFSDIKLQRNFDKNIILGVADIRGEMLTIVSFDNWLGFWDTNENDYNEIIISNYGKNKFGLAIRESEFIVNIESSKMTKSSDGDSKSTFISTVNLDGKDVLCTIVDSDKITIDAFSSKKDEIENELLLINEKINSNKYIFFADDSSLVRNLLVKSATKMNAKCKVFENGLELVEAILDTDIDDIGLIVTDLEMPVMDGKEAIKKIRENSIFDHINIVVYTNMANEIMKNELIKIGATQVQTKIDIDSLNKTIKELII